MRQRVLLLGGTGYIGREVAGELLSAGHALTLLSRGEREIPPPFRKFHLKADRKNPDDLARVRAQGDWDVIIDNAAYEARDVSLVLSIFGGVKRYLFTSSVAVYRYSKTGRRPYRETDVDYSASPSAEDLSLEYWKYARGKLEAEKMLLAQHRIGWTIIRPSYVYGPCDPNERSYFYLQRILDQRPILLANGGINSFRPVYVKDLARLYRQVIERPQSTGKAYNASQREIITLRDFVEDQSQALGLSCRTVALPDSILGRSRGPFTQMVNEIAEISLAQHDLSFEPTPWVDAATVTARWFRDNGYRRRVDDPPSEETTLLERWRELARSFA